ncbi:MAG: serine/threonine protein kinase [Verrucomicrobiaceae bacterium]|nr:serine/threonine protein kinase [Verrucomicrobiaceae bacterium]
MSTRFVPRGIISRGRQSVVHRAWDSRTQRQVAVKRVDADSGDALRHEARILEAAANPHVVTFLDSGTDDDGAFLVMEPLDGETLEQFVARAPLDAADIEAVASQVLAALVALHGRGIVHLDIKPENLMVSRKPGGTLDVKLIDFGAALEMVGGTFRHGDHEPVVGSLFFVAPERFDRAPADPRADLYSLGCVCYHAATGQCPFQGDTAPQVMVAHVRHVFTPLAVLRPDLPEHLRMWIERMFARDASARPESAAAALEALHDHRAVP